MGYEDESGHAGSAIKVVELPVSAGASTLTAMSAKISRSVIGVWWRHSSMSGAVELAEPFLKDYARKNPAKFVGYGAGTGALLWILKPWKLLSMATILTLLLKSSGSTGLIADLLGKASAPPDASALPGRRR